MKGVVLSYLRDKRNMILGYVIGSVAFLEMYIALYPSIRETSAQLNDLIKTYPDAFFKAFGMEKGDLAFSTVESFLATEQFSFLLPILIVILCISLANAILVADIDKGTAELTLSQPISRTKIFLARYFSGAALVSLFISVSVYAAIPLLELHKINYDITKFNTVALVGLFFALAVFSLGSLFSVVFSERGKATFATSGIVILMYVLNILSTLKESLSNLKYGSFFYYFSPSQALSKGNLVDFAIPVLGGFSLVMIVLSIIWFNKRDIAV